MGTLNKVQLREVAHIFIAFSPLIQALNCTHFPHSFFSYSSGNSDQQVINCGLCVASTSVEVPKEQVPHPFLNTYTACSLAMEGMNYGIYECQWGCFTKSSQGVLEF